MTTPSFGERLKREREMRGVSLDEVSVATRIGTRYLEALETEQWQALPGTAFNRGFIRTICRYLGMDEDSMLAEYAIATKSIPEPAPRHMEPIQLSARWPKPVLIAIFSVLVIGILVVAFVVYRNRHKANHSQLQILPSRYDVSIGSRSSLPLGCTAKQCSTT